MASGFPGGDPGLYGGGGRRSLGNGFLESNTNGVNSGNGLYRFQQHQNQQQQAGNPGQQIGYRRPDFTMIGKRSLAEFQASSQQPQSGYFQQTALAGGGGGGAFLRSMKQRTGGFNGGYQNHALSPISPLSPSIDLCSPVNNNNFDHNHSASLSSVSSLSAASSARFGAPFNYHHQPNLKPNNSENNTATENGNQMMKATLQDLEKYLFDDDGDENRIGGGEAENDAVSAITNNNDDWSQTFQDLISPNPTATTAVTAAAPASTIYTSPTTSTSSCSSSKTPPPPPLLAPTPPTAAKPAEIIAEAAMAIVDGKSEEIAETLARLAQAASPTGDPEQRMAFYMLHALRCRVSPEENPPPVGELYNAKHLESVHALYDLSPCFKFARLSSNLLIMEAIASTMQENNGAPKVVHIVDFDVGHGRQYGNLLHAVMERATQMLPLPLELKITAVETETKDCEEATKRVEAARECLMKIVAEKGEAARFKLTFNSVTRSVNELTRESIGCGPNDTLVANFAFRLFRVPDESVSVENFRDELLRRVRAMQPWVVTVAEQELSANTAPFAARVGECAGYYGAVLESLELAGESSERARVEEAVGRKAANAVACEGRERVERCEVFGKWRARMGMAGFKARPVGRGMAESMRANLPNRGGSPGFTVKEENGGVCFGWMGRTLTVASAWR